MNKQCMILDEEKRELIEKYGYLIIGTDEALITELMEAPPASVFTNAALALMQNSVSAQIRLLKKLKKDGLLVIPKGEEPKQDNVKAIMAKEFPQVEYEARDDEKRHQITVMIKNGDPSAIEDMLVSKIPAIWSVKVFAI